MYTGTYYRLPISVSVALIDTPNRPPQGQAKARLVLD
jgi:hypothetical protein